MVVKVKMKKYNHKVYVFKNELVDELIKEYGLVQSGKQEKLDGIVASVLYASDDFSINELTDEQKKFVIVDNKIFF